MTGATNLFDKPTSLEEKANQVEFQIQRLAREMRQVRDDNKILLEERRQLRSTVEKQREEIRHFQEQIKSSMIVSAMAAGDGEADAMRYRIDEYVKEIERCIAHLSE